jgi:hypothetical protein
MWCDCLMMSATVKWASACQHCRLCWTTLAAAAAVDATVVHAGSEVGQGAS